MLRVKQMKKVIFIKNAAILTVTSLALHLLGVFFKVWLAKRIGAEGIGLYQLIFSVYVLASAFASAGICTAVTRLTAEELSFGGNPFPLLRRALLLTLGIAAVSVAILFCGAEKIAALFLNDTRAVPALKTLPFALPFMGISSCLRGYFVARRNVAPNALSQIFEQSLRIATVFLLVGRFAGEGLAVSCKAVLLGDVAAEGGACLLIALFCFFDKKRLPRGQKATCSPGGTRKLLHISLPITAGKYLNTALRTAENILVPQKLTAYSADSAASLSQFGMIKGMALPVLLFPATLLGAVSTLLIPEISESAAKGRRGIVKSATEYILKLTAVMAFLFGAVFFAAGEEIGMLIYRDGKVGALLQALSPIVPLMYLESICDGILKGLDQQGFTFRTAISDSLLRVALVVAILPFTGLKGFLFIMYLSNLLTCGLNVGRLVRVSGARPKWGFHFCLPLLTASLSSLLCRAVFRLSPAVPAVFCLLLFLLFSAVFYFSLLLCFGVIKKEDLSRLLGR